MLLPAALCASCLGAARPADTSASGAPASSTSGPASPGAHPAVGAPESPSGPPAPAGFRFVDVAEAAGITRVVLAGRPGKDHLLDSAGSGVAWIDYDGDGWIDAYIVNAWRIEGDQIAERGRNALYRNRGDGTFEDVTDRAGVGGEGHWGCGVAVADYDDDGRPDLFLTNFGPNVLYRNRGDGTFENVAARAGLESPSWNTGAAFLDADADGDLDLYIAAYIEQTVEDVLKARRTLDWKGVEKVALGPFGMPGAADRFFLNDGKGRYTDTTEAAGLADHAKAYGFGVRAADFDQDGDLDLYVANDSDANYLYRNQRDGTFQEVGLWSGAAFSATGAAQAGMGVAAGDAGGDGVLDLFVTNFSEDFSTLYRGDGRGFFEDISEKSGAGPPTFTPLSWGTVMADLDNDGDDDIVVANGHIYPQVDDHPEFGLRYAQRSTLLENAGGGSFVEVTEGAGPGFVTMHPSRGLAAGDYDNDGDLDLLISVLDGPPRLLRNDSARGHWLTVIVQTPGGRGPLIGTQVKVTAGGRTFLRDVASSESYLSAHDQRLHFGLGPAASAARVEVIWPDGTRTVRENFAADRFLAVPKGE